MNSFREFILLRLIKRLRGDRTIRAAYHILTGKKSAQTIQDIKWYQLTAYYQMFPNWSSPSFEELTNSLRRDKYISGDTLTSLGEERYTHLDRIYTIPPHFNGWKHGEVASLFWKRLSLFVQALSHAVKRDRYYIPVISDWEVQMWVKSNWPRTEETKLEWLHGIYSELSSALQQLSPEDATIFTFRLSGYKETGRTFQQLGEVHCLEKEEVYVRFYGVLHYLLEQSPYSPYLFLFAKDLKKKEKLTTTAQLTKKMLERGDSLEDIERHRGLKRSTIEDHLVEIASETDDFPIQQYVPRDIQNIIIQTVTKEETYRLKKIKNILTEKGYESISYFDIRLTLACDERRDNE